MRAHGKTSCSLAHRVVAMLDATCTFEGEGGVLTLSGRLTAENSASLKSAILDAFARSKDVVLTLKDVTDADLSFMQIIAAAHMTADGMGGSFAIHNFDAEKLRRPARGSGFSCHGIFNYHH